MNKSCYSLQLPPHILPGFLLLVGSRLNTTTCTPPLQVEVSMVILFSVKVFIIHCVRRQVVTDAGGRERTMVTFTSLMHPAARTCILRKQISMQQHSFFYVSHETLATLLTVRSVSHVVEIPYCNNNKIFIAILLQRRRVRRFVL